MRKLIVFILFVLPFSVSFWMNPADYLKKVDNNFQSQCFENYEKINKIQVWNNDGWRYKTYKVLTEKENLVFTQFGFILPYKRYIDNDNSYLYSINRKLDYKFLNDNNKKTFFENDTNSLWKELILEIYEENNWPKELKKWNFDFDFDYDSKYYFPRFYIIQKWKEVEVSKDNIEDFSFSKLIIRFESLSRAREIAESIKIYELSFTKTLKTYLVKSFYNDDIEVYSNYNCKERKNYIPKAYSSFEIDKETKAIELKLETNPKYNVYKENDIDNDWVSDENDNCKTRYNPNQLDSGWNWIWDVCSDFDKDWIIWYYDNCPMVPNRDQKDININWIWDVCEFDKDEDWIFDSEDNCISVKNKNQNDLDRDWIWDICDNCKLFNPAQLDKNNSWVWDVCEAKEKELKENDSDNDWIIDWNDNCKELPNKDQLDADSDSIWDVCDNCKEIQNTKQIDLDENKVWDMCEDSDNDWFLWYLDNCISIENKDQKDSDNDWIGDLCEDKDSDKILFWMDNCPFDYNPDQSDIDEDGSWDRCDKEDWRYIESNKSFFIWLLVFIVILFWIGIFFMMKKLENKKK